MGAGRKTITHPPKEKTTRQWTVNSSISARNLKKCDLGAVIFGCKHATIKECLMKNLFGLPSSHFSYVKNVTPGLVLFLFNYSDRKLHGIFEAVSPGKLNINPYGWTKNGEEYTPYPAQVQVRVRKQCRPLKEEEFSAIIAENYYDQEHFWFELDRTQTSKLMDLFSSQPSSFPHCGHHLKDTSAERSTFKDTEERADHVDIPNEGTAWDTWKRTSENPKPEGECFHAPIVNSQSSSSLPQKSWISLFKASSASFTTSKVENLKPQTSKLLHEPDHSKMECQGSCVSSSLNEEDQSFGSADEGDTEVNEMPASVKEGSGLKSMGLGLDFQQKDELSWELPCVTHGFGRDSRPLESSVENVAIVIDNYVGACAKDTGDEHFDFQSVVTQLIWEVGELKQSQLNQNVKIKSLEQELVQSKVKILELRNQIKLLASRPTASSSVQFEEVDFEALDPFPQSDDSILVVGGYDGSCWLSDFSLYSATFDLVKALRPMTFQRSYISAAQLNGEPFLLGGGYGDIWYNTVESYNLMHNQWVTQPSLNEKKGSLAGISVFDKLYAIGGGNGVACFSEVEMLDTNIGKWIFTKSMKQKRLSPAVANISGVIYAVGGYDGANYLNSVERFDPREHKWTGLQSMSSRRGCHSVVALNEKLYAMGGYDGHRMVSTVEIFDPLVGSWMMGEPMTNPRGYSAAVVIGGKIYTIGGLDDNDMILDSIECYEVGDGWQTTNLNALGKRCFFSALAL